MNICICALAKNENLYIKEWVDYHLSLGFDSIYIYDNNDLHGEHVTDIINGYDNVYVFEKFRRVHERSLQAIIYSEFFKRYKDKYNWITFIDIDEFIVLESHKNIHDFLSENYFKEADIVRLNWKHYTDNEELDIINNNYKVFDRFKTEISVPIEDNKGKSIVKTSIKTFGNNPIGPHGCYDNKEIEYNAVNAIGEKCLNQKFNVSDKPLYKVAWINHYRTKTIGEFIRQKYFRGDINRVDSRYNRLKYFWTTNNYSEEKENYANKLIIENIKKY